MRGQRETPDWSKSQLSRRAKVDYPRIGAIEAKRVVPYPAELLRLARALRWGGDREQLLEEVSIDVYDKR
jgi:ribosome-binding protein aMBF1 (putative translation factor)